MTDGNAEVEEIIVIGGGIGGLTVAAALQWLGRRVLVFERASSYAPLGSGLSIMGNAVTALKQVGLDEVVSQSGCELKSFRVVDKEGHPIFESPLQRAGDHLGTKSLCVSRADLQDGLLKCLKPGSVSFSKVCTGIKIESNAPEILVASFADGSEVRTKAIIGADGLNSVTRKYVAGADTERHTRFDAYLAISAYHDDYIGEGGVIHFWGHGERVGLIDLGRGRVYWWVTMNTPSTGAVTSMSKQSLRARFGPWHPSIDRSIAATIHDTIPLVRTRDRKPIIQWTRGPVCLLGDAAHPMLTSIGQGAGIAIEDAVVLAQCLARESDPARAMQIYESRRVRRGNQFVQFARSVAWYEQLDSPWACSLRNTIFRCIPKVVLEAQAKSLIRFEGGLP